MSCNGTPAIPNQAYASDQFAATGTALKVTCDGSACAATVTDHGNGFKSVRIPAVHVFCPGPIVAKEGNTQVYCAKVEPCP